MRSDKTQIAGLKIDIKRAESEEKFDSNTSEAVRLYQKFNKLPVTGNLDDSTLELISRPRCGVPDIVEERLETLAYCTNSRWDHLALSFRFENFTGQLDQATIRRAIYSALNPQWDLFVRWNSQK